MITGNGNNKMCLYADDANLKLSCSSMDLIPPNQIQSKCWNLLSPIGHVSTVAVTVILMIILTIQIILKPTI